MVIPLAARRRVNNHAQSGRGNHRCEDRGARRTIADILPQWQAHQEPVASCADSSGRRIGGSPLIHRNRLLRGAHDNPICTNGHSARGKTSREQPSPIWAYGRLGGCSGYMRFRDVRIKSIRNKDALPYRRCGIMLVSRLGETPCHTCPHGDIWYWPFRVVSVFVCAHGHLFKLFLSRYGAVLRFSPPSLLGDNCCGRAASARLTLVFQAWQPFHTACVASLATA